MLEITCRLTDVIGEQEGVERHAYVRSIKILTLCKETAADGGRCLHTYTDVALQQQEIARLS